MLNSSDQSINALLVRDIEQNGTGRKSYSVHNSFGTGGNTVTLPFILAGESDPISTSLIHQLLRQQVQIVTNDELPRRRDRHQLPRR